jgi:nucleoside phosphorylase
VSRVPVYFSHSYRREDRDLNDHFWHAFWDANFSFTVDPGSTSLSTTTLERMMARSVGFAAVVTFRPEEAEYQCSPFVLYEYGLAVQVDRPRLVLRDRRVSPRFFQAPDTLEVEFDVVALDRCAEQLGEQLRKFHGATSRHPAGRRYRRGKVGVVFGPGSIDDAADLSARWAVLDGIIRAGGDDVLDLLDHSDDPLELAKAADGCDFVVVDLDDHQATGIADFLLGRGTPLLKVARRDTDKVLPGRLLGSAPVRRAAAADELVAYWSDIEDFEARLRHRIQLATTDREEFVSFEEGHQYFRRLGRESRPVFVSNAGPRNDLAKELAQALQFESIPFFHYRYENTIGRGQRWAEALDGLIGASKVFVPLIDDSYWASKYCQAEYDTARRLAEAGRLTIVPGLLEGHQSGPEVPYQGTDLRDRTRTEQVQLLVSQLDEMLVAGAEDIAVPAGSSWGADPMIAGATKVDVAIITILEEEYEAVLRLLSRRREVAGSDTMPNQHAWVVGAVDPLVGQEPYTVVLAMSPHAGTNAAVIATRNTLEAFDPGAVLVVGVAGGLSGTDLGDVVVADRICAYEYMKVDHGYHARNDLDTRTDPALTSAARTLQLRHPDWYSRLEQPDELRTLTPRILVGNVASGDKVVDDPTDAFFASVTRSRPKVRAVEMEGAGAAAAIQDAREKQRGVAFGMVRGISDLPRAGGSEPGVQAGHTRQTEIRDFWKGRASAAAAACAIQLIRLSWPRPPRGGSRSG